MELVTTAADQVQRERQRLGMTHAQLAQALGVHARTVERWELGEFKPHEVYLTRMRKMQPELQHEKMVTDG